MLKLRASVLLMFAMALMTLGATPALAAPTAPKEYSPSTFTQGTLATNLNGKIFHVKNSMAPSAAYLDVDGGNQNNGGKVQVWGKTNVNPQRWLFTHLGNGVYRITNVHSGKALDVPGGSRSAGVNVQQYTSNSSNAQKWRVYRVGSQYCIVNVGSGLALDVPDGRTKAGTAVRQWWRNDGGAERWVLEQVNVPLKSLTLNKRSHTMYVGDSLNLNYSFGPANTTVRTIPTWSTSNSNVATVSNGRVVAKKAGTVAIKVHMGSRYDVCKVTVVNRPAAAPSKPVTKPTAKPAQSYNDANLARQIFDEYNAFRNSARATKTTWSPLLEQYALNCAKDCAKRNALVHARQSSTGGIPVWDQNKFSDILQSSTWKKTPREIVNTWKGSTGHRKMMQCNNFSPDRKSYTMHAGAAAYYDANTAKWYYVIVYNWVGSNQSGS